MPELHQFFQDRTVEPGERVETIGEKPSLHPFFSSETTTIPQRSIGKIGQFAAGALQTATFPLDIYEALARGEALSDIEDLRRIPGFDEQKYMKATEEATSLIPTQSKAEKFLQEKTGIRFEPEGAGEEYARLGGQLLSPKGWFQGGIKEIAKTTAKKTAGALGGAAVTKGLEVVGVNPYIALLIGAGISSIGQAEKKLLSDEGQKIKSMSERYGLKQAEFMVREDYKAPPIITKSRAEEVKKEIGKTSKKSIDKIIESKLPISNLRKQGISLDDYTEELLNKADEAAKLIEKPISLAPVVNSITKKINEIKKSAPHLSMEDDKTISILRDIRKDFIEKPKKIAPSPIIYDQFGHAIEKTKEPLKAKKIPAITLIKQYRKVNTDRKAFWKKPEMRGIEAAADRAYGIVNESMIEAAKKPGTSKFVIPFQAANAAYHQLSNLRQTESILRPFFEDYNPKTLDRIIKNDSKTKFLSRAIGVDGLNDLKNISKYGSSAIEKLEKHFAVSGDNWVDIAKNLGKASVIALINPSAAAAMDLGIGASYIRGLMLTSMPIRKSYVDLVKAVSTGSERAIKVASTKLNKEFYSEYGDIDDILNHPEKME